MAGNPAFNLIELFIFSSDSFTLLFKSLIGSKLLVSGRRLSDDGSTILMIFSSLIILGADY